MLLVPDLAEPEQRHDLNELGVNRRAMEAFVVVLHDDLPVRGDVVLAPRTDHELPHAVARPLPRIVAAPPRELLAKRRR